MSERQYALQETGVCIDETEGKRKPIVNGWGSGLVT